MLRDLTARRRGSLRNYRRGSRKSRKTYPFSFFSSPSSLNSSQTPFSFRTESLFRGKRCKRRKPPAAQRIPGPLLFDIETDRNHHRNRNN
jgi:hypothetical protein